MYLSYFGLSDRPFSITPDPRFLYLSDRHREAFSHLLYGLGEHGGFVQLTGEVGTGKTTLCRYLLQRLPSEVDVALVLNSRLSAPELLAALCDELHIPYPAGTTSIKTLVDGLYRHLLDAHARGRRTVLIVDEAQNLGVDALEQIRMLTNLETSRAKLLQIILIGQPELVPLLDRPDLRQLAQRITARYHLMPFSAQETRAYILYRMQVAGQAERIFEDAALDEVYARSRGIPRLINVLCDRALLGAYATRRSTVDAAVVRRAADEVLGRGAGPGRSRRPRIRRALPTMAGTAAVTAVLALATLQPAWVLDRVDDARRVVGAAVSVSPTSTTDDGAEPSGAVASATGGADVAATVLASDVVRLLEVAAVDRSAAFSDLYALWGVDLREADPQLVCDPPRSTGLRCFAAQGPWHLLRRLDMPAVLELVTPAGDRRFAVLSGLDGDVAVLETGAERHAVPLGELDAAWRGTFTLLWRRPAVGSLPMGPGAYGPGVAWLRQRLAELAGRPQAVAPSQVYDDDLKQKVIAFQLSQFLDPDGIVGDQTLIRLAAALDRRAPSLSAGRSRT